MIRIRTRDKINKGDNMNILSFWSMKKTSTKEKILTIQKVYDNCWASETTLFNAMSKIVEICHESGPTAINKVDEIKQVAFDAIERSKQIGLTNPDIYGSMNRRNSLARQMKQARMDEKKRCQED
jgi:hypothetical protein